MTRITTFDIPGVPGYDQGCDFPWMWPGNYALTATVAPWKDAPIGSVYILILAGSVSWYMKVAHTEAATDWKIILRVDATITGDLTLTGTLTAGDYATSP